MYQPLIMPLTPFVQKALKMFPSILEDVLPLSQVHKAQLPQTIFNLSEILTSKRKFLSQPYWKTPGFVSAYMWYFFPWNIIRLTQLLSGLKLKTTSSAQAIDLGSGPLTLPLALWLSRPELRKHKLRFICVDTSPYIMKVGLEFFQKLTVQMNEPLLWKFHLAHDFWLKPLRTLSSVSFVMAGNILNEVSTQQHKGAMLHVDELMNVTRRCLDPEGFAFFVEPGTRLGGIIMSRLRQAAFSQKFISLAPCTHTRSCPLFGNTKRGWCHVSFKANAPEWLTKLTHLAKLNKNMLSLSFQLFQHSKKDSIKKDASLFKGRIVSDAFQIPNKGYVRYVCMAHGLGIIQGARDIPFGSSIICKYPDIIEKDARSGAVFLEIMQ